MEFAKRLKKAMDDHGCSAAELSRRTKLSRGSISQYLSGKFKPNNDSAMRIAKALSVDFQWLLTGSAGTRGVVKDPSDDTAIVRSGVALDISSAINNFKKELLSADGILFDGVPLDDESVGLILNAMEVGLRMAQDNNKKRLSDV